MFMEASFTPPWSFMNPINISVAAGYGSIAEAGQTNNVNVNQSAVQMAGTGGNGGDGKYRVGWQPRHFLLRLRRDRDRRQQRRQWRQRHLLRNAGDAPIVIYHPINIAVRGAGGTGPKLLSRIRWTSIKLLSR